MGEEKRVIRVIISEKHYAELEKEAQKKNKTVSELLSEKITKEIFEKKKPQEEQKTT